MVAPANYDFVWVRGTTTPLRATFKINDVAIPYTDIRLSVYKGIFKGALAFRLSLEEDGDSSGDPGTVKENEPGDLSFIPSEAQTRMLLQSSNDGSAGKNSYEIEVRNGKDAEVYIMGIIAGVGGINDDEA